MTSRVFRRAVRGAILAVFVVAPVAAQVAATAPFPPVPLNVAKFDVPADRADSDFAAWRHAQLPRHDKTPAAWTMRAGDWDFLLATPRAMNAMDSSRIIDTTLANCTSSLNLSTADSAYAASARPWAAFDSAVADRPAFVISIMPVLRHFTECGWKNLGRPAMIGRGMRFVTEFAYDASRDPVSAVLVSRLRIVKTAVLARAPVVVVSRDGIPSRATDQLRLYIPFDAIAPNTTGDLPQIELLIWSKAGGEPDHIPLPNDIIRTVWWDYLRWRAQRLAARDGATQATPDALRRRIVTVPMPSDAALREALRLQHESRDAEASKIILERLADEKLSAEDRRIALMSLASTFQADDDPAAAAFVASELTSMDPCALRGTSLSPRAPIGNDEYTSMRATAALLDRTRPGIRCTSAWPGETLLRGILFPGGGQFATWSRLMGITIGAITLGGGAAAYAYKVSSDNLYSRYQTTLNPTGVPYFNMAVNAQKHAQQIAHEAADFWIATAVEAEIQERIRALGLAEVDRFWVRPIVTAPPGLGSDAVGLAAGVTLRFR